MTAAEQQSVNDLVRVIRESHELNTKLITGFLEGNTKLITEAMEQHRVIVTELKEQVDRLGDQFYDNEQRLIDTQAKICVIQKDMQIVAERLARGDAQFARIERKLEGERGE